MIQNAIITYDLIIICNLQFASSNGIEFLPMRVWIGLWVAVISTITVAAEGSFLIRYVTRFTEEIFAILISIIFIYEVVKKLVYVGLFFF